MKNLKTDLFFNILIEACVVYTCCSVLFHHTLSYPLCILFVAGYKAAQVLGAYAAITGINAWKNRKNLNVSS